MRILREFAAQLVEMFSVEKRSTLAVFALAAATGLLVDVAALDRRAEDTPT